MQANTETLQRIYTIAAEYLLKYGFQILFGILILIVGFKLAGWASRVFAKMCEERHMDITLTHFLSGVVRIVVIVFAALMAVDKFGITISPLLATVSAMIFGASFAIQAPLSNYAAGLSIILTRPFTVGNTVTVKGFTGVVEDVKLPCTVLSTSDGEIITIPNKDIVGEVIINSMENKVVETTIGISYGDDPQKAIEIITAVIQGFPQILKSPAPQIGIQSFGESSVIILTRFWAPTKQHLKVLHDVNMAVYKAIQKANITIPFPQREIRVSPVAQPALLR